MDERQGFAQLVVRVVDFDETNQIESDEKLQGEDCAVEHRDVYVAHDSGPLSVGGHITTTKCIMILMTTESTNDEHLQALIDEAVAIAVSAALTNSKLQADPDVSSAEVDKAEEASVAADELAEEAVEVETIDEVEVIIDDLKAEKDIVEDIAADHDIEPSDVVVEDPPPIPEPTDAPTEVVDAPTEVDPLDVVDATLDDIGDVVDGATIPPPDEKPDRGHPFWTGDVFGRFRR